MSVDLVAIVFVSVSLLSQSPGYGARRERLLAKCKVVLNIHYYEAGLLETPRLQYLLSLRRFVLSEATPDTHATHTFRRALVFAPYEGLLDAVLYWLAQPAAARHAIADAGYAHITSVPMTHVVRPLVQEAIQQTLGLSCQFSQ